MRIRLPWRTLLPRAVRQSYRSKLFIAFLILGTLASIDTTLYIARLWYRERLIHLQSVLLATTVQLADALDTDAVTALRATDDLHADDRFNALRTHLLRSRDTAQAAFAVSADDAEIVPEISDVYIIAPTERDGTGRLLVTSHAAEAARSYDMTRLPLMMAAWSAPAVEDEAYTDEYGTTLSAYAPIRSERGDVIAIVGMDVSATYLEIAVVRIVLLAVAMFVAAVAFSMFFAWATSRAMTRSLVRLTAGMRQVADGDLDVTLERGGAEDEFGLLIQRFNDMVRGVRAHRALQQDVNDAAAIQACLLPTEAPTLPGFDLAGGIRYCQTAGGDSYDYVDVSESGSVQWGVVVGDVTGHGIASALMMCSARAVLRAAAARVGRDPGAVMRSVNAHLVRDSPVGAFMTAFYGVLDVDARTLHWCSAGHEPGVLRRAATGDVVALSSGDIPLGVLNDRAFPEGEVVTFRPGDVLVVGTDGLSQARDADGEFFGFERMAAIVAQQADATAAEIRDALHDAARAWAGHDELDDDITVVVIRAT